MVNITTIKIVFILLSFFFSSYNLFESEELHMMKKRMIIKVQVAKSN